MKIALYTVHLQYCTNSFARTPLLGKYSRYKYVLYAERHERGDEVETGRLFCWKIWTNLQNAIRRHGCCRRCCSCWCIKCCGMKTDLVCLFFISNGKRISWPFNAVSFRCYRHLLHAVFYVNRWDRVRPVASVSEREKDQRIMHIVTKRLKCLIPAGVER